MIGLTLDAGALIAIERNDRSMLALLVRTRAAKQPIAIPAGALAQVWRDGARQTRLATLLSDDRVQVVALDARASREAGQLCGLTATADVIDASVVLCARRRQHTVATSDPDDLRRLDPRVELIVV